MKLSGINHQRAVRALKKAGWRVIRQGKHISMSDGAKVVTTPRANPVDAFTMGGIIKDAGMTIREFKALL